MEKLKLKRYSVHVECKYQILRTSIKEAMALNDWADQKNGDFDR